MKKSKILATILTVILAAGLLSGCGASKESSSKEGDGQNTIVVGTNPTFAPFEYQDEKGNMEGFDLDLLTAIGEDQGFAVEFKSLEFDALTGALATGDIDVAAAGISITPERNEKVLFVGPYMDASLGIVVAIDNNSITTKDDLKGLVVGAQIGTTGAAAAMELQEQGVIKEAKQLSDFNVCIQELKNGGVDAIINDMPVNEAYMAKHPNDVKVLNALYATDYYAMTVSKDNKELQEKLNTGLKNVIASGKFQELCAKYDLPVPMSVVNGEVSIQSVLDAQKNVA